MIDPSGVVPFHRFDPVRARAELLELRAGRPPVPTHPMATVTEESIATADGSVKVRILTPRVIAAPGRYPIARRRI